MNCPICTAPIMIVSPKPRCLSCGYVESCCNPEVPCEILPEMLAAGPGEILPEMPAAGPKDAPAQSKPQPSTVVK